MSAWTPEVRERLDRVAAGYDEDAHGVDVDAALQHIDALEARVAVLAAECRAWRAWNDEARRSIILPGSLANPEPYRVKLVAARAATDAAGALEGGRS